MGHNSRTLICLSSYFSATSYYILKRNLFLASKMMNSNGVKHGMADRLKGTDKNVWVEFGKLAVENKACNLGQGFPDFSPPERVVSALAIVANSDNPFMHQYARSYGHPRLINALAELYSPI